MSADGLSLDALADAAQEPIERIRDWDGLGLLPREGGEFGADALGRARLVSFAVRRGIAAEAKTVVRRLWVASLTRVAETEIRLFHFYVHEHLRAGGLTGGELDAASDAVSAPLQGAVEPAVRYFHRKAWARALREDMVLHLAEDLAGEGDAVGQMLFVDLANFTPMTGAMGDTAAATVIGRFSDLVREAASESDGRVLKQIGDEFMLVFSSGMQAVSCGRSIMAKAGPRTSSPTFASALTPAMLFTARATTSARR